MLYIVPLSELQMDLIVGVGVIQILVQPFFGSGSIVVQPSRLQFTQARRLHHNQTDPLPDRLSGSVNSHADVFWAEYAQRRVRSFLLTPLCHPSTIPALRLYGIRRS
jgi:hypothetical protein